MRQSSSIINLNNFKLTRRMIIKRKQNLLTPLFVMLISSTLALAIEYGNVDGDVRVVHLGDSTGADNGSEASATGASLFLQYSSPEFYSTRLTLGTRAVTQVYENSADGSISSLGLVSIDDNDQKTHLALALANLSYETSDLVIRIGNQILDTPNVNADDVRLMPNYFQALYAEYWVTQQIMLSGAYITGMMGWESSAKDPYKFSSMSKSAFGKDVSDSALSYFNSAYFNEEHTLDANIWFYNLPSYINLNETTSALTSAIAQVNKEFVADTLKVNTSAQYVMLEQSSGKYSISGLQLTTQYEDFLFELDMNKVGGTKQVEHFWGGVPEYCAMQEYDLGAFGDHGYIENAYKALFNLDLSAGTSFQIAKAIYQGKNSAQFNIKKIDITDVMMSFTRSGLDFAMLYEHLQYHKSDKSTQKAPLDNSVIRIAMSYLF
jgi:hypothetical protein